jgi:hypothetical protein
VFQYHSLNAFTSWNERPVMTEQGGGRPQGKDGKHFGKIRRESSGEGTAWDIKLVGVVTLAQCWSQGPRGERRGTVTARLLRSWVRMSPGAWMFVCCECRELSDRSLRDGMITRPEESYRMWCVVVCDLEIYE